MSQKSKKRFSAHYQFQSGDLIIPIEKRLSAKTLEEITAHLELLTTKHKRRKIMSYNDFKEYEKYSKTDNPLTEEKNIQTSYQVKEVDTEKYGIPNEQHSMMSTWEPTPWALDSLSYLHIDRKFIDSKIPEFREYWMKTDRKSFRTGWNITFQRYIASGVARLIERFDEKLNDKEH